MCQSKKNHNTSISSATRYTESRKKVHEASSISDRLELKRGCVRERLSVSHTTGSQMGFCAAERVNKLFLFSVQTELKLSQKLQHGNELYLVTTTINKPKKKKISFTKKRCIQPWFKTCTNGKGIAVGLMTARIDMAELKSVNLKRMQKKKKPLTRDVKRKTSWYKMISERKQNK